MKKNIGTESTVLVVDDEQSLLEVIADELQEHFSTVITTDRATKAIEIIKQQKIDCVITDYKMPEMNGLEFIAYLQKNNPDLPVILLTGNGSNPEVIKAIEEGLFDYLDKPFKSQVLVNRVRNALLLPRLENLILEIIKSDFPDLNVSHILRASAEDRLKHLSGLEALIRTRLMAKAKTKKTA